MRADRLQRRAEHHVVVLAPPEDRIRERDQAYRLVVRPVLQVRVERDVQARVRILRQHLPLDEIGEALGVRAVVGRDRLVRSEDLEERHPGASAASDRRVVVADAVVNRPRRERQRPRPRHTRQPAQTGGARRRTRRAVRRRRAGGAPGSPAEPGRERRARPRPRRSARSTVDPWHASAASAQTASPVANTASLEAWW